MFTNDQIDLANQQMADVFTKNPKLDAFILVGGWAQFGPQAYAQVTDQVMAKLKSKELIIIAGDTLPPQLAALKAGRSHAQIGQRPFEMGHRAPAVLIDLINGKKVADPLYTASTSARPPTWASARRSSPNLRTSLEGARRRPCFVPEDDSTMAILELAGVSKHFGAIQALINVSLSLNPGEVVGLMGDNGAGKSTLVKIVAGNFPPSGGTIDACRGARSPSTSRPTRAEKASRSSTRTSRCATTSPPRRMSISVAS